jgi:hypothetical protein
MAKELITISPEGLEVANSYLVLGNIKGVSQELNVPQHLVSEHLEKREVKKYIDNVYLDSGYRNRNNIANLLDEMIESKIEEAKASEVYTKKDLFDLLTLAQKIRNDEVKNQNDTSKIGSQTNVQINDVGGLFGKDSNYGALMDKLINGETV